MAGSATTPRTWCVGCPVQAARSCPGSIGRRSDRATRAGLGARPHHLTLGRPDGDPRRPGRPDRRPGRRRPATRRPDRATRGDPTGVRPGDPTGRPDRGSAARRPDRRPDRGSAAGSADWSCEIAPEARRLPSARVGNGNLVGEACSLGVTPSGHPWLCRFSPLWRLGGAPVPLRLVVRTSVAAKSDR